MRKPIKKAAAGKKAPASKGASANKAAAKKNQAPGNKAAGKKPAAGTKKAAGKKAAGGAKKQALKKDSITFIPPGQDMYLIPVKGEIHPARIKEKGKFENNFHHNEEVALHQEQMRVKSMMSSNRKRKIFNQPRFA